MPDPSALETAARELDAALQRVTYTVIAPVDLTAYSDVRNAELALRAALDAEPVDFEAEADADAEDDEAEASLNLDAEPVGEVEAHRAVPGIPSKEDPPHTCAVENHCKACAAMHLRWSQKETADATREHRIRTALDAEVRSLQSEVMAEREKANAAHDVAAKAHAAGEAAAMGKVRGLVSECKYTEANTVLIALLELLPTDGGT